MSSTLTPSSIGARAEAAVASALVRAGRAVFVPVFAAHDRIDLIAASGGEILRVQCKTSRLLDDVLTFRTCSNTANIPRTYHGEVDAFGVYSPDLEMVYIVPVDDVPTRTGRLRLAPTRNGQVERVRWAKDYVLGPP